MLFKAKWAEGPGHQEVKPVLGGRKKVVWVAEDDREMRRMVAATLRRLGFDVEEIEDGAELLKRLESLEGRTSFDAPPDLVVTDHHMPRVHGLDAIDILHDSLPTVPFILITAFGDKQTHQRAADLGAVGVLDKPFDLRALRELVMGALAR